MREKASYEILMTIISNLGGEKIGGKEEEGPGSLGSNREGIR